MHQLRLQIEHVGGLQEIRLAGAVEPSNFPALASTLRRSIDAGKPAIILDCREVTHFGSAELKELHDLVMHARALGGDIRCVGLLPQIRQVVSLIAGSDALHCHDDLLDAIAAFHNGATVAV